jgi:GNAT superfamily N-acetyltransferase
VTLEGLHERLLDVGDISAALQLSAEPGWNQVAADWRLMIEHGDAFGFASLDGRLVASGLTVVFGGPFAWISMILVTAAYRRRGLATGLMQRCMDALERRGLTAALDASPEGRQVYLRLGFKDVYATTRMFSSGGMADRPATTGPALHIRSMSSPDLPALAAYDRAPFGADRAYMLDHLRSRLPPSALVAVRSGRIAGFILGRDGRACIQLGPLVADDLGTAIGLLSSALLAVPGPVCVDIADHHAGLRRWLDEHGFVPVVPFTRMLFGRSEPFDDPQRIFAIAGPELG